MNKEDGEVISYLDEDETIIEILKIEEERIKNSLFKNDDSFSQKQYEYRHSGTRLIEGSRIADLKTILRDDLNRTAKDRASKTVAMWLHETMLVDEYFLNMQSFSPSKDFSELANLKESDEGVEVGPNGYTVGENEDQIEKKFKELKAIITREKDTTEVEFHRAEQALFPLDKFPNLGEYSSIVQSAVRALVNISSIMSDIEYFQTIPETCDRLQTELALKWDNWLGVKQIVHDHIGMQSFLVNLTLEWMNRKKFTVAEVNLETRINPIRRLGHTLESKILHSIGNMFCESKYMKLKYIIEIIELYEGESSKFLGLDSNHLMKIKPIMITDIRKIATRRILDESEIHIHNVFRCFQEEAANNAVSMTAEQMAFAATLNACLTFTKKVYDVKRNTISIFPKTWGIFSIWSALTGSICCQYIFQKIGGEEGNNLSCLLPKQLLKLMAWIEEFRLACGFSNNSTFYTEYKPSFISTEELKMDERMQHHQHSLAVVVSVLWDIHRLIEDQFMLATQLLTNKWLENVFRVDHSKNQSNEGHLQTSLPEDLWTFTRVQLTTIQDQFVTKTDVFFHAACIIFRCIQTKCRSNWDTLNKDVEMCCAAANDALRMIQLAELEIERIKLDVDVDDKQSQNLENVIEQLSTQFLQHAVLSASMVHSYIFEALDDVLTCRIFELEWEELSYNDMAIIIVHTLEDYLKDMEYWLEDLMLRKVLDALVKATINFYVKHLLKKSIRSQKHTFFNIDRALQRVTGDIYVLEEFFQNWVKKFPALERILRHEFRFLHTILKLLKVGHGIDQNLDLVELFTFLHKYIGNMELTRFLCCQLCHILSLEHELFMQEQFDLFEENFTREDTSTFFENSIYPGLSLIDIIQECRDKLKKRLNVKAIAQKATKNIVKKAGKLGKKAAKVIY